MTTRPLTRLDVPPGPAGVADLLSALPAALSGSGPAVAPVDPTVPATLAAAIAAAVRTDEPVAGDVAVVVATSGSTGAPAGVELSGAALTAAAAAGLSRLGGPGHWLVAVPVTSVGGLMTLVRSVTAGTDPVIWSGLGGAEPFAAESFARAATKLFDRAGSEPTYVSLVPTQIERLVRAGGPALELLARFSAVLVGAAELPAAVHRQAVAAGAHIVRSYGMSEACGGVCYEGRLLPGVSAHILDPDSHWFGRIVVDGPVLATGYRLDPQRTAARFRKDGFHTDDLGHLDGELLTVVGRIDDVIQVGGTSVSLNAVTELLRSVPGATDGIAVARPDIEWGARVVAVVVGYHGAQDADLLPVLQRLVSDRLGRLAAPVALRYVPEIPLLPNGKPDRAALTDLATS